MDLQMAATPLYVTIGILTAVGAILSAGIRQSQNLRPSSTVMNIMAMLLLLGVWISIFQILLTMVIHNSYELMSALAVFLFFGALRFPCHHGNSKRRMVLVHSAI